MPNSKAAKIKQQMGDLKAVVRCRYIASFLKKTYHGNRSQDKCFHDMVGK